MYNKFTGQISPILRSCCKKQYYKEEVGMKTNFSKRISLFLAMLMIFALLTGCGSETVKDGNSDTTNTETPGSETKKMILGITVPAIDADGFKVNVESAAIVAKERNVEFISFSAQNSVEKQVSQIEDMIAQGVSAIIINPTDANALGVAIEKANAANIPIVAMDGNISGGKIACLVESDNVAHGMAAADLMAEAAKKAGIPLDQLKVLELLGDQATTSGLERHEGFEARAKELGIEIVVSLPTMWQNDKAYAATLDAFQANDGINAIFEASDIAMHSGVEAALTQINKLLPAGEDGHIIITAVDGGPKGMEAIRNKYIDGIATQQLIMMGKKSAEIAIDAAEGKPVAESVVRLLPDLTFFENVDSKDHWANQLK
ncbi:MAG: hypothetical protein CVV02_03865 [Firmicutes bacterium HGW-Firmicutes-7]|nr:MAG: hypothetical protein CVV02_03865 [Firmicutes bacterium HGW-Firmicutes-7]